MDNGFIIPLNGLAVGGDRFFWQTGVEFFESFDNSEILDAQLVINARAEKLGRSVNVDCKVDGSVIVECDRCLDRLVLPVFADIRLSVRFGQESDSEEVSQEDREIIYVPAEDTTLEMAQIIYDYVCTSLPIQRIHQYGECNALAVSYLSLEQNEVEQEDNPFSALKDMFK